MGIPEILTILILIALIIFPVWLSIFLRKRYPKRIWIALILGFFFPAFGQFYVAEKVGWYVLGLGLCFVLFKVIFGSQGAWLLVSVLSSLTLWYRVLRAQSLPAYRKT